MVTNSLHAAMTSLDRTPAEPGHPRVGGRGRAGQWQSAGITDVISADGPPKLILPQGKRADPAGSGTLARVHKRSRLTLTAASEVRARFGQPH